MIDIEMIKSFLDENIDFALVFTKFDKCNQKNRSKNIKDFDSELVKL
jgi:GTP-binding protein EngB required for normal cell division